MTNITQPQFIGIWRNWYAQEIGVSEKEILINGKHGKAAKTLIKHFKEVYPDTCPGDCLKAILNNWERLPAAFKDNCKEIHSIANNLNHLINHIKNASTKTRGLKQTEIDRAISDIQEGRTF